MLGACRLTDAFRTMPTSAGDIQTETWRLSALGRFHRVQFSAADAATFEQLEPIFMPLVEAFFHADESRAGRVYRSELQLLTATPTHSQDQSWHADNVARGITIVVPLVLLEFMPYSGGGATLVFFGFLSAFGRSVGRQSKYAAHGRSNP